MSRTHHPDLRRRAVRAEEHCEFFVDECSDAGFVDDAAALRASAAAVARARDDVDAAHDDAAQALVRLKKAHTQLTRVNHRFAVDVVARLPPGVAVELAVVARVGPVAVASYRLARIDGVARGALGAVVDDVDNALRAAHAAADHVLAADARERRAVMALEAIAQDARRACERAKALLLASGRLDDDAVDRVSRHVVRTRPAGLTG